MGLLSKWMQAEDDKESTKQYLGDDDAILSEIVAVVAGDDF